ncbi:hypothetical protein SETIT_2G099600v2 [Setaria italica]|uniref:Uncharacterized protein n=1 Tax=Setaria italica TaxID=4555 RepID=A0A368PWU8_SETIT|nr:uncharacterized protein LOC101771281 isoform X1 [Setaria italica]RCV10276.1 hypothetical protein SETIT_2G099600v2 [Setaria italica]
MASSKKASLFISLLLLLLLVSAVHGDGAKPAADARDTAAAGDGGQRVTVRTGHGHGYSSHSGGHTGGASAEKGGAGVVDPRNPNARSHRSGAAAASRAALGYSCAVVWGLVGAILAVVALP